ncbi:TlpA family protein disulfide reductase [Dyadobacter sp. BHUBP1]|uniref:TlpA family protein disulfide reductase n=1 Tax=Dyadobacter sp. BHUBP1 TaxID=3424178 RepID=UPI003D328562
MASKFMLAFGIAVVNLMLFSIGSEMPNPYSGGKEGSFLLKDTNSVQLQDISGNVLTLDDVKRQHQGKVIFIEYWASWCAPCRELMPASEAVRADVKDLEVAYVYLSLDSDHDKWIKASREERISDYSLNYRVTNGRTSEFLKKYNINFIPQAMVLGKSGMVLNTKLVPGAKTLVPYLTSLSRN